MMRDAPLDLARIPEALAELVKRTESFIRAAKAPSTLRAYRSDWRDFEIWCHRYRQNSLPADPRTVALYIADLASCCASATIVRRLTAITKAHQTAGYAESPATARQGIVGETLKGIRRTIGTSQKGRIRF